MKVEGFGCQRADDRRQRTEDRGQRTENRGQRAEGGEQKTEGGGQKSEVGIRKAACDDLSRVEDGFFGFWISILKFP